MPNLDELLGREILRDMPDHDPNIVFERVQAKTRRLAIRRRAAAALVGALVFVGGGGFAYAAFNSDRDPTPALQSSPPAAASSEPCTELNGLWEPWLRSLLVQVGAPEGWNLRADEITNTGSALQIAPSEYEGRMNVYVYANYPDTRHDPRSAMEQIGSIGEYEVYTNSNASGTFQQYSAIGPDVWLTLYAYSADPSGEVMWTDSNAAKTWIKRMLDAIAQGPLPHCIRVIDAP